MSKKKIILYKNIPSNLKRLLESQFNVIYFNKINEETYPKFIQELLTADGLIGSSFNLKGEILDLAKNVKVISTISAGYDNFDVEELTRKGIRLMHTPDVLTDTTADLIFTLLLTTARRVVEASNFIYQGKWNKSIDESLFGTDVHHKKIGIIGMGKIGMALAKRAHMGFDMEVLYTNRSRKIDVENEYKAKWCNLDELLSTSDFVCITLPLTKETENLINKEKLSLMKPTSILINGGRGRIIDQEALIQALKDREILAAGLDVFATEPIPLTSDLLTLPNVVITPHIGSATFETRYRMAEEAVYNLINAFKEEKPKRNLVNTNVV